MANQYNASDKDAVVTISGGGLIANSSSGGGGVRAVNSWNTGKHSFSVSGDVVTTNVWPGVSLAGANRQYGDANGVGCTYYPAAGGWIIIQNNAIASTDATSGVGNPEIITVHVDLTNHKIYFQSNVSGNLFGGNPAAGTGGFTIPAGALFPNVTVYQPAAAPGATINFNPTGLPSGYTAWADGNNAPGAITGTLAITQANQTLAATGNVPVIGTLARTQANQTLVATGNVPVIGTLAVTEANDTIVAAGKVTVGGTLSITQANQTIVAAGKVIVGGTLAITQANQTIVATGKVTVGGTLAVTEANDTLVATGTVTGAAGIVGTLNVTEAPDTIVASGKVTVGGTLNVTEANDTLVATGFVPLAPLIGTLAVIEDRDGLVAAGQLSTAQPGKLEFGLKAIINSW